jgi:hypothetical protein
VPDYSLNKKHIAKVY